MRKLVLISILIADIVIPIWASRKKNGRSALKKAVIGVLVFNVIYFAAVAVFPQLI